MVRSTQATAPSRAASSTIEMGAVRPSRVQPDAGPSAPALTAAAPGPSLPMAAVATRAPDEGPSSSGPSARSGLSRLLCCFPTRTQEPEPEPAPAALSQIACVTEAIQRIDKIFTLQSRCQAELFAFGGAEFGTVDNEFNIYGALWNSWKVVDATSVAIKSDAIREADRLALLLPDNFSPALKKRAIVDFIISYLALRRFGADVTLRPEDLVSKVMPHLRYVHLLRVCDVRQLRVGTGKVETPSLMREVLRSAASGSTLHQALLEQRWQPFESDLEARLSLLMYHPRSDQFAPAELEKANLKDSTQGSEFFKMVGNPYFVRALTAAAASPWREEQAQSELSTRVASIAELRGPAPGLLHSVRQMGNSALEWFAATAPQTDPNQRNFESSKAQFLNYRRDDRNWEVFANQLVRQIENTRLPAACKMQFLQGAIELYQSLKAEDSLPEIKFATIQFELFGPA